MTGRRRWGGVCLVTALVFVALGVGATQGVFPGDAAVRETLQADLLPAIQAAVALFNPLGSTRVLVPATALLILCSRHARRQWWLWCSVLIFAPVVEGMVKPLVGRLRPTGTAFGFPSGHATAAMAFAVVVFYVMGRDDLPPLLRRAVRVSVVTASVAVGLARILLDAHWPSDVLGGWALGIACAAGGAWWDAARALPPGPGAAGPVARDGEG